MSKETKSTLVVCAAIVLVGIVLALINGCQTAKGLCGDSAWILQSTADNIQPK